jgi:hypothetical protein
MAKSSASGLVRTPSVPKSRSANKQAKKTLQQRKEMAHSLPKGILNPESSPILDNARQYRKIEFALRTHNCLFLLGRSLDCQKKDCACERQSAKFAAA